MITTRPKGQNRIIELYELVHLHVCIMQNKAIPTRDTHIFNVQKDRKDHIENIIGFNFTVPLFQMDD